MASMLTSLADPAKGYKIFEPDQVLTDDQLNQLATYLDDQERLTRVALLGVGIVCGLRAAVTEAGVQLTSGVAVTTDGDLIRVPAPLTYTRFRKYDQNAPRYDPFYNGNNMITVWELTGDDIAAASPLANFPQQANNKQIVNMTALLVMESYAKDGDLCTGGDCDNKGKDAISNVKLLLLDPNDAAALGGPPATLDAIGQGLVPVVANRVILNAALDSPNALANAYLAACKTTLASLQPALQNLINTCASFLGDIFPVNPVNGWAANLNTQKGSAQYCYDFLKDIVDTYNEFRDAITGDTAVCCPSLTAFQKHVVLGVLSANADTDASRTKFYPSPLVRERGETLGRARFLARRLDALITSVDTAAKLPNIVVTPSAGEERRLEDRAIPGYYTVNANGANRPVYRAWNYELNRRNQDQYNYSSRRDEYAAAGTRDTQLAGQIGRNDFFRIEGHIGLDPTAAVNALKKLIADTNLPFSVRAVLIGGDRPHIVIKPGTWFGPLHQFHFVLRQDLLQQIDQVNAHNTAFGTDIGAGIANGNVPETKPFGGDVGVKEFVQNRQTAAAQAGKSVQDKMQGTYTNYRAAGRWQDDFTTTLTNSLQMKQQLGDVARTEFATPVDAMVSNYHAPWIDFVGQLIQNNDDKHNDKLLFANFIKDHPEAEHFGGVCRGGTFVLLYDSTPTVVGDVMLPYWWPEPADEPPAPPINWPHILPDYIHLKPVSVLPTLPNVIDLHMKDQLTAFKAISVDPVIQQAGEFQKMYVQSLRDSVTVLGSTAGRANPVPLNPKIADPALDGLLQDMRQKTDIVNGYRKTLTDPAADPGARDKAAVSLQQAETDLSASIVKASNYAATNVNVDAHTDGAAAAQAVSDAMSSLGVKSATATAQQMQQTLNNAANKGNQVLLNGALRGRGFVNQ